MEKAAKGKNFLVVVVVVTPKAPLLSLENIYKAPKSKPQPKLIARL